MTDAIHDKVRDLIADMFGVPDSKVLPETAIFDDLGADSLDCIELVMHVEEEFLIEILDAEAEKVVLVRDIVSLIERKTMPPMQIEYPEMDTFNPHGSGPTPIGPREDAA